MEETAGGASVPLPTKEKAKLAGTRAMKPRTIGFVKRPIIVSDSYGVLSMIPRCYSVFRLLLFFNEIKIYC